MKKTILLFSFITHLFFVLFVSILLSSPAAHALGALENPPASGWVSGIEVVSGWHCTAGAITFKVVCTSSPYCNQIFTAASGTNRPDTQSACGDTNNGFASLINYNEFGDGEHTIIAYADGVEFANTTFNVTTLGQAFVTDIVPSTAAFELYISQHNKSLGIAWQQSKQNFSVVAVDDLPNTYSQLVDKLKGNWLGNWVSRTSGGAMSMELDSSIVAGFGELVYIHDVDLANISCDEGDFYVDPVLNWSQARTLLQYIGDGSEVYYEFLFPAYHNETLTGIFYYEMGPCAGSFGSFSLFKQH